MAVSLSSHIRDRRRRRQTASMPVGDGDRREWRLLIPLAMGALGVVHAAGPTTHTDGVTYCWKVGGSVYSSALNDSTAVEEAQQNDCALTLTLDLGKDTFFVNEAIQARWTATLRRDDNGSFQPNKFQISELSAAQDRISQHMCEIIYSRIESCSSGALDCDPVTGETDLAANVPNRPTNFSGNSASFTADRLAFSNAGSTKVVAHVILPGANPDQQRYDFAMYKTITINERPTLSPVKNESSQSQSQTKVSSTSTDDGGLSTEAICIIFVCGMVGIALVGVGFTTMRKKKPLQPKLDKAPDALSRNHATSTSIDDEFAMLSNEERLMQSQRPRGNTFLTAAKAGRNEPSMLEESRAVATKKPDAPMPYVGPARDPNQPRLNRLNGGTEMDLSSDDHIVDSSNPASMRHNGVYMEMHPQVSVPRYSTVPPKIDFNDIRDDEIIHDTGPRRDLPVDVHPNLTSGINPYADSRAPPGLPLLPLEPSDEASAWRPSSRLTFDDLRPSVDVGPALTLDDLLENKGKKRGGRKGRTISEDSEL